MVIILVDDTKSKIFLELLILLSASQLSNSSSFDNVDKTFKSLFIKLIDLTVLIILKPNLDNSECVKNNMVTACHINTQLVILIISSNTFFFKSEPKKSFIFTTPNNNSKLKPTNTNSEAVSQVYFLFLII